ncbi:MAG: DUF2723 domain-containing protein [Bacteroidota bacterium]
MNDRKLYTLTGWGIFAVALLVYLLTVAPTASFWDCGEFIACANELEVTHPPGAPFFLLIGRLFAMLSFGVESNVAYMVNLVSVLASAFTAMFTCWITIHFAEKGLAAALWSGHTKRIAITGAGIVAGLTCTFADSIWFNAVEAEVYAFSSFFTAIVVWLMLRWEKEADRPDHLRWIILIAYVMGLSTGVHLLNLLTIPALALIYYFRKYDFSWIGLLATLGISVSILAFIQYGILQSSISLAWAFERFFTGTVTRAGVDQGGLGMPMGTGTAILVVLVLATWLGLMWFSHRQRKVVLNTALLAFATVVIGFSSYLVIFVRSNVDPPIEMNNPENIRTFLSYMKREQYGDRPLVRGPLYNAQVERDNDGYAKREVKGMKYMLLEGQDKYVEDVEDVKYVFADKDLVWFPRMYDPGRYNMGAFGYINYVENKGTDPKSPYDDKPTKLEDWKFFFDYQVNHMYLRYFFWNFVGRESDVQEARWESGFEFGDSTRYTEAKKRNKGKNHYFFLPLFFGLLGLIWHFIFSKQDAAVVGFLFFCTGLAIILYLNQYPLQPRERDYSFAGSFQTFAIWVGLGVLFLVDLIRKYNKQLAPWIASGLALLAPLLMGFQNWDDHSRKGRYIDIEFAKNLLSSCAPNAIMFTGGDNDTFPLWYVQEVEGYRTDVRVVNLELLISDWYIDQMKQQKNESAPLPIKMEKQKYAGEKGLLIQGYPSRPIALPVDSASLVQNGMLTPTEAQWLEPQMVWDFKGRGSQRNPYILRKDSVIIDLMRNISANNWKRPIYFANTMQPSSFLGLGEYLRMEGLAYRITPIKRSTETPNDIYNGWIAQERMFTNLTENFLFTGLDDPSINFDAHIRQVIVGNYRNAFFRLANSYAEQIVNSAQVLQQLRTIEQEEGVLSDSLLTVKKQMEARTTLARDRIGALFAFEEKHLPETVIEKPLALAVSEVQMLERIGLGKQAAAMMDRSMIRALEQLNLIHAAKTRLDPQSLLFGPLSSGCNFTCARDNRTLLNHGPSGLMTRLNQILGSRYCSRLWGNRRKPQGREDEHSNSKLLFFLY